MKKQDITYQDKLNELRLDILHPNNKDVAFVFLEGESDIRLFRKLFNLDSCKVENIPGGKQKLEECVAELINIYPLVIGIRDADFINLGNVPFTNAGIFLTDLHDMEMILVSEDQVFSALIFEYTAAVKEDHSEIRSNIMKTIKQIGLLKWLNEIENLEYNFVSGFQDLISYANLEIDFEQYFARVLQKSPNAKITEANILLDKLNSLNESNPHPFQLCNGHDFLKALSKYLRDFGNGKAIGEDDISSSSRMVFTFEHFQKTQLFAETKLWSDANGNCLYIP